MIFYQFITAHCAVVAFAKSGASTLLSIFQRFVLTLRYNWVTYCSYLFLLNVAYFLKKMFLIYFFTAIKKKKKKHSLLLLYSLHA